MQNVLSISEESVVGAFAREWAIKEEANSVLYLAASNFGIFETAIEPEATKVKSLDELSSNKKFDLIFGDFPFGLPQTSSEINGVVVDAPQNWIDLAKSLLLLSGSGTALFVVEPLAFSNKKGAKFESFLSELGYYVNGIFNCPNHLLKPVNSITPVIVAISRQGTERLFVAELLNVEQARQIVEGYFSAKDSGDLSSGIYIDKCEYRGFSRIKAQQQIERLETQYKTFEQHRLGDLAVEIKSVKSSDLFEESANAIYIPNIGTSPVVSGIEELRLKHHNYFQVVFTEVATAEYLVTFFRSALGEIILSSLTQQNYIPRLNKQDLEDAIVALPNLQEQQLIVAASRKLQTLKKSIEDFDSQLALNPTSSKTVLGQLDAIMEVIGSLSSADRVRALVREGETKTIEFKETFSLNLATGEKDKENIEHASLKTIIAFLNTDGGTLLIGVSDKGEIPGIFPEIAKFHGKITDKFLGHFKNALKERVGEGKYPFIDTNIVEVDGNLVFVIDCKQSPKACFLKGKRGDEFYVRTNPATDKLDGQKMLDYLENHFRG